MYKSFAYVYDKLTYDIDYGVWGDYIEKVFERYGYVPESILDLACGTGSFCIEMAKKNYEVTGLDISDDMLACALNKSTQENLKVRFLNGNMINFDLNRKFDAILCLLDSVNYIIKDEELLEFFCCVSKHLEKTQGVFIFDINTEYKLRDVIGDNIFYDISDELTLLWTNRYNPRTKICTFDITVFIKEGYLYQKFDEIHYEKAHSIEKIKNLLKKSGMEFVEILDNLSLDMHNEKSERIFFVCKKI